MNPQYPNLWKLSPLQYSSRTLPTTQFKSGLLADKLSEVQMLYFYLCLSVCQYLWIIKFLELTMVPYSKAHSKGKVHKNRQTDKKLNHLSFQSTEQLNNNMGIKRDKSGKSSSQIVPRIWNSITHNSIQVGFACRQTFRSSNVIFLFVFECVSVFMNYKVSGVGI
jgi:hypothetical protein